MTGTLKKILSGAGVICLWVGIWALISALGPDSYTKTTPFDVSKELVSGVSGAYLIPVLTSLKRIVIGFSLALVVGFTLGALLATNKAARVLLGPLVLGVQSLPSICWLPVAIVWMGLNERAILFVVLMGSVGSVTIAVKDGLTNVPVILKRVSSTFGAGYFERLFLVILPAALPSILSGIRQGWSFAWRSLMAGELLYHSKSLGSLLSDARDMADYPALFAVMIVIVLISLAVEKLFFTPLVNSVNKRWGIVEAVKG